MHKDFGIDDWDRGVSGIESDSGVWCFWYVGGDGYILMVLELDVVGL